MSSPLTYTILLVEDNTELLHLLELSLTHLGGFKVVTASDGIRALEQFEASRPDCVVVDLRIPGIDGYQLIRTLRGDPATGTTPVIVLTALAQEHDRFAGLASGADIYLTKPVMPPQLIRAIHQAIARDDEGRLRQLQELVDLPPDGSTRTWS